MKIDHDLFSNLRWTHKFSGQCVIYMLEWNGKKYIGSTSDLRVRMGSTRLALRKRGIAACMVRNVVSVRSEDRFLLETANVEKFGTRYPVGHNKTKTGRGGGPGRGAETVVPPQPKDTRFPDVLASSAWADKYHGKCMLYVLEWECKKYVGTSVELATRLNVHRRYLKSTGVVNAKVIHLFEIPVIRRKELETKAIEQYGSLQPNGHNRSANGGLSGNWNNPEYRNMQKAAWEDVDRRTAAKLVMHRRWATKKDREEFMEVLNDPIRRATHSKKVKENWANPEKRALYLAARAISISTPEYKRKISDTMRAKWRDPEYRKLMLEKRSDIMRAKWQDPEYRKSMLEKRGIK